MLGHRLCLSIFAVLVLISPAHPKNQAVPPDFSYPETGFSVVKPECVSGRSVSGSAVDEIGRPIESVLVEITRSASRRRIMATFTDDHGRFVLEKIPTGKLQLRFTGPGLRPTVVPLHVKRGAHPAVIEITLSNAT
jgi:hypothetical protein